MAMSDKCPAYAPFFGTMGITAAMAFTGLCRSPRNGRVVLMGLLGVRQLLALLTAQLSLALASPLWL
jgi:hypothetical protein